MAKDEVKSPRLEELEAQKLEQEIEKLRHDVSTSANKAHLTALELQDRERREADNQADADVARIYSFLESVTTDSVADCMDDLGIWARRDPGRPITIIFNSPGGSVIEGLALYDFLDDLKKSHDVEITTVARGMAASMGGVLLQAGDKRIVGRNAHVLIHEVSSVGFGKLSEMEDEVKFCKRLQERLLDILADRSTMSKRQIRTKWKRKDWWLDAKETVSLGFADEIG